MDSTAGKRMAKKKKEKIYTHPWCGKRFHIKAEWWNIEANPNMCCIEHCEIDSQSCENARNEWESGMK